jgi:hypothetical protein
MMMKIGFWNVVGVLVVVMIDFGGVVVVDTIVGDGVVVLVKDVVDFVSDDVVVVAVVAVVVVVVVVVVDEAAVVDDVELVTVNQSCLDQLMVNEGYLGQFGSNIVDQYAVNVTNSF